MVETANRDLYFHNCLSINIIMAGRAKSSWLSCFKQRQAEEISPYFLRNGGVLLQKLIATFGGRYQIPINYFTAEQLTIATDHFAHSFRDDIYEKSYRGSLDGRSILVIKYWDRSDYLLDHAITDLVVSSQLSHLKNVLKFIGCCLEFKVPVLVYEAAGARLLCDFFPSSNNGEFLPWKSRVRIAKDIASTLTYLHTAFSAPIIHRDVRPRNVIIDQCGNAKLFNFSLCISLPPGRKHVEDIAGTVGYIAPEHLQSGRVTPKVDVYSFGILLVELLMGAHLFEGLNLRQIDHDYWNLTGLPGARLIEIVDHKIWEAEEEMQFRAFLDLALRCIQTKGEDRPDMIDVAKELCRIEKNEPISSSI